MEETAIKEKLERAAKALFANQPNIFDFTSETGQTEWNLAHHLANEIYKFFPDLACDFDIIKVNSGDRRPDIIFHERGSHDANFLVIEVKRDGEPAGIRADVEKIKSFWFGGPLHYQFGAVVNLKSDKTYKVQVFKNN